MSCVYVCIEGKRKLLSGDCPIVPCAEDGGECFIPNAVSVSPCPDPWVPLAPESEPTPAKE